jgi:enamine deaminase RidA (YjgF/YER057c/UK114 family)
MGKIDDRLAELGIELPAKMAAPPGIELPFELVVVESGFAYISGHGPMDGANLLYTGRVGTDVSVEDAYTAARATGLSILASLRDALGDLDRVTRWVKALGFVNCGEGFNLTPLVMNGFSDLVVEVWGEAGRHARSAIGAGELPLGMSVEVEAIVAVA